MAVQALLARADAIDRTLTLLTARLAEIDEEPDPDTVALAGRLRREAAARNPSAPSSADATAAAGIR